MESRREFFDEEKSQRFLKHINREFMNGALKADAPPKLAPQKVALQGQLLSEQMLS